MKKLPETVLLPEGTEFNYGPSEDSDSVIAIRPVRIIKLESKNSVWKIKFVDENENISDESFFLHQPPKPNDQAFDNFRRRRTLRSKRVERRSV